MNLEQLRYFECVAALGSFAKAADRMFITKNGLTYQIKQMERELGFELFERDSHHVDLTLKGSMLLPAARQMLATWDESIDRISLVAPDASSVIKIGMAYFMDPDLLAAVDKAFKGAVPEAQVRPYHAGILNPSVYTDGLARGSLDAAFMSRRETGGSPSLSFVPLCPMLYGVHTAAGSPLAAMDEVRWDDLDGHVVALLSGVRRPENHTFLEDTEALFRQRCPAASIIYVDSFETERYVVEHDGAVSVFPFTCRREAEDERLVLKVLSGVVEELGIAYPAASESRLLKAYVDACGEVYRDAAPSWQSPC